MKRLLLSSILALVLPLLLPAQSIRWTQTPGPYSAHVYSIVASGSTLYASTFQGALYHSDDYGQTWVRGDSTLPYIYQNGILADGGTVWHFSGSGVYRTDDGGNSWTRPMSGMKGQDVDGYVRFANGLYVATTTAGIHRTTNNGESWQQMNTGLKSLKTHVMASVGSALLVMTDDGLYRSLDSGRNWKATGVKFDGQITAFTTSSDTVWLTTYSSSRLYRSLDSGLTWTKMYDIPGFQKIHSILADQGVLYIAADYLGIRRSSDGGETWERVDGYDTWLATTSFVRAGDRLFAGTGRGVFESNLNGTNWTQRNTGLLQTSITLMTTRGARLYVGCNSDGIYRTDDGGKTWEQVNDGLGNISLWCLTTVGDTLWTGTDRGLFRSVNGGDNWEAVGTQFAQNAVRTLISYKGAIYIASEQSIYRTTDNGATWTAFPLGPSFSDARTFTIVDDVLMVGCTAGIWRTIDGENWTRSVAGLTDIHAVTLAVAGETVFAGTWDGVFRSTDKGLTWAKTDTLLNGRVLQSLIAANGWLIAGTQSHGIYISSNNGADWSQVNDGLRYLSAKALAAIGTTIYAGLQPGGVYRTEIAPLSVPTKEQRIKTMDLSFNNGSLIQEKRP